MPAEGDGVFVFIDVDTLRRNKEAKKGFHWKGRVHRRRSWGHNTCFQLIRCHVPEMNAPMQKIVLHGLWELNLPIRW